MSKEPSLAVLKKTAIEAAEASGKILLKHFGKNLNIREKKDAGLVTQADVQSEAAALKILRGKFPNFGVLAEESDPIESEDEGRWIIDPLDGTTNYVHGFPMFCVTLAAEFRGELKVGVIYHPILKDWYVAVKGQGATLNGKPISVSKTKRIYDSLLTTGFSYRKTEIQHEEMEAFERLSGIARAIRRPGSAALDMAYVARGVFDGFWERRLSPWDVAAGTLLIREAGGIVTNLEGGRNIIGSPGIIASNKYLHSDLRKAVAPESCPI